MSERAIPRRTTLRRDRLTWGLLAASIAVIFVNGVVGVVNDHAMDEAQRWVTRTHEVLEASQRVLLGLEDAETGQRGFLITGTPAYLEPYESSLPEVREAFTRLVELTRDSPAQEGRLDEIRPLIEKKLAEMSRTVELRKEPGGEESARAVVLSNEGKALMDAIRVKIAALSEAEVSLEHERARRYRLNSTGAVLGDVLGALLGIGLVAWGFWLLQARRRERECAAALFESEGERLRTTLTSIGDAVIVTDEGGRVTLLNGVAEELTGYKHAEAIGEPLQKVFQIVNEDTRATVESPVDRVLRDGVVVGLANHTALVAKNGTERPIADSGAPIRDTSGRITGVVLVFRDQTEERKREDESARLAAIVETSDDAILSKDLRGTILTWNAAATRMLGYSADEAVGKPMSLIIPPDRLDEEANILTRIRAGQRVTHFETQRVTRDGRIRDVAITVSPLWDRDGRIVGASKILRDVTEEKRARMALRESEERLRLFVDHAPAAVAMFDRDMRYLAVSRRFAEDYRLRPKDLVGKSHYELFPEVPERWKQIHQRCLNGAVAKCEEDPFPRADGSVDWVKWEIHPWRTAQGSIGGIVLFSELVTHRKRTEEALRAGEERLRLALEAANAGSWEWDLGTDKRTWSDGLWRLYGVEPGGPEASYAISRDSIHPEDRARVEEAVQIAVRTGSELKLEWRVKDPDGSIRWLSSRGRPGRDERGAVVRYRGIVLDTTERKKAEEALLRGRHGLSRLAEASLRVVQETDLKGMLQAISEAALALTDARVAVCGHGDVGGRAMVGGSARVPGAPACGPGDMFLLERGGVHMELVEGAESIRLTDRELRAHPRFWGAPAGHVPMRGLLGARMVGRDGKASGMILVTDKVEGDFSEEEESLLRQLATIASLALQHVQARIALEESNKSKNQFLAMLSHELRNPLAPIGNSLFILDRTTAGGEQAKRAQAVIHRQVGHLTHLVDDLLDITRISHGKIQLKLERLDLDEVIRRAVDDHRSVLEQNGLRLDLDLPKSPLFVHADRTRLVQIVGNLLQNSAKFTERGGQISVSLSTSDHLGRAVLRVKDSGVGIGADMLPRIFVPFAQADTTLARSKGDLGLGLALVKALIEMHGGSVTVHSEGLGKGAEFAIYLPLDGVDVTTPVPAPEGPASVRKRRILIVEDNLDSATTLRDLLELDGHTVALARTGKEGIESARRLSPDVVLCDVGLPDIDGFEVARAIRGDPALAATRLVALTGYAAPDEVSRSKAAGFDEHVAKPATAEVLRGVLAAGKS